MPDALFEREAFEALAASVARSRADAGRLGVPFASRLLDMCLVEIVMTWLGRERRASAGRPGDPVNMALEAKMRIAAAERDAERGG